MRRASGDLIHRKLKRAAGALIGKIYRYHHRHSQGYTEHREYQLPRMVPEITRTGTPHDAGHQLTLSLGSVSRPFSSVNSRSARCTASWEWVTKNKVLPVLRTSRSSSCSM